MLSIRNLLPNDPLNCYVMAMTFAPDWAEAYNGQQGDVWDAQRDMALAGCGAIFGVGIAGALKRGSRSPKA